MVRQVTFLLGSLANVLNKDNRTDLFAIRWALDRAIASSKGQSFKLHVGDDVGTAGVVHLRHIGRIEHVVTRGLNDSTHLNITGGSRLDSNLDLEAPWSTFGLGDSRIQVNSDIGVSVNRSDCSIDICRRRVGIRHLDRDALVQLGHPATQCACLLDQHHIVTRLGRFDRRSHTGDTAANNQQGLVQFLLAAWRWDVHVLAFGTGHTNQIVAHFLSGFLGFIRVRTNPDTTFTQVSA